MQHDRIVSLCEQIGQLVLHDAKGTSRMLGHQAYSFSLSDGVTDTEFDRRWWGRGAGHVTSKDPPTLTTAARGAFAPVNAPERRRFVIVDVMLLAATPLTTSAKMLAHRPRYLQPLFARPTLDFAGQQSDSTDRGSAESFKPHAPPRFVPGLWLMGAA